MIEMVVRLGLSLVLSLSLAVLLAWNWNHSDQIASGKSDMVVATPSANPLN